MAAPQSSPARIAANRADAVATAALDPGKEGALAQRYITAAARDLSRALRDLHLVEPRHGSPADPAADFAAEVGPEPGIAPGPNAAPNAESVPGFPADPVAGGVVMARLASFGGVAPAAALVVEPPAREHAIPLVHAAEPVLFSPLLRQ